MFSGSFLLQRKGAGSTSEKPLDAKVINYFSDVFLFSLYFFIMRFYIEYNVIFCCCPQTLRRLAQNREAARKSRLRKKVCPSNCVQTHLVVDK